jgi:hypothetical protein
VRRLEAYQAGERILPAACWRDHRAVAHWAADIPAGSQVVCYCIHGHNVSQLAVAVLRAHGIRARALDGGFEGWQAAGGLTVSRSALACAGTRSNWVTRVRPKVDRIACPWLVHRFIDRDAEFLFVAPDQVEAVAQELGAIPYDVPGVALTHAGELCSFDMILRTFGLVDPALDRLAAIVRGADTARPDLAPQAAGLLAISLGISTLSGGDDRAALARGFAVYDALLAWCRHAAGETHSWVGRAAPERGNG